MYSGNVTNIINDRLAVAFFSHFYVWCTFTLPWQKSWILTAFNCDCSEAKLSRTKASTVTSLWKPQIHRLLCLSTSFSSLKKNKYSSSLSSSRCCPDHRRTNPFYRLGVIVTWLKCLWVSFLRAYICGRTFELLSKSSRGHYKSPLLCFKKPIISVEAASYR